MTVEVDRAAKGWVGRRTFCYRPAIVRANDAVVDLLEGRLADIVDEHAGRASLKGEGKRVAKAKRPDRSILSGRGIVERVIGRDGTVGIDAQHLAEQVGKDLCV